ncbi:MAG: hypothetical protein H7831_05880, partial [Magnetococcus sp. WYHC-3]
MRATAALTADQLEEHLEHLLDAALNPRMTVTAAAAALAGCCRSDQDQVLHWVGIMARTNPQSAWHFARQAAGALPLLGRDGLGRWALKALDHFDRQGLRAALAVLENAPGEALLLADDPRAARLEDVRGILDTFLCALSGRRLELASASRPCSDTRTLYLPPRLDLLPTRADNELLYRALAAFLWAQTRCGTLSPELAPWLESHPEPDVLARRYFTLEAQRLQALLQRLLPGLLRRLTPFFPMSSPPHWAMELTRPDADARLSRTLAWGRSHWEPPPLPFWQGDWDWRAAATVMQRELAREQRLLRQIVAELFTARGETPVRLDGAPRLTAQRTEHPEGWSVTLTLDGRPMIPPEG